MLSFSPQCIQTTEMVYFVAIDKKSRVNEILSTHEKKSRHGLLFQGKGDSVVSVYSLLVWIFFLSFFLFLFFFLRAV